MVHLTPQSVALLIQNPNNPTAAIIAFAIFFNIVATAPLAGNAALERSAILQALWYLPCQGPYAELLRNLKMYAHHVDTQQGLTPAAQAFIRNEQVIVHRLLTRMTLSTYQPTPEESAFMHQVSFSGDVERWTRMNYMLAPYNVQVLMRTDA
ncbi:hypothetical protein J4E85_000265 [Alternaria conjuncta]|uniref:uncharacterized protein n=1 Tax=Alternaria conjuncta TaxID=181017 RepID=UPI00222086FC|nr:uncharacterized protein J4E85_000265 [Alternaria conjuncta]KAI4937829.1 hypothetical protein J4E85_000265 [Alternaria conjuncta]